MNSVITNRVNKSKNLLIPLIGFSNKKGLLKKKEIPFNISSYLKWGEVCGIECMELLVYIKDTEGEIFSRFEDSIIVNNPRFTSKFEIEEGGFAYLYDLSEYYETISLFMEGKYSKFSNTIKNMIRNYHSDSPIVTNSMPILGAHFKIILYPEYYFKGAAEQLRVPLSIIESVGELMSIPSIEEETFNLKLLKDESFTRESPTNGEIGDTLQL